MKTVFIKGNGQFKKRLRRALSKSVLQERIDYLEGSDSGEYILIWVLREELSLRELKEAITAKEIFRYRMRFYGSVSELAPAQSQSCELTDSDRELMNRYLLRVAKRGLIRQAV